MSAIVLGEIAQPTYSRQRGRISSERERDRDASLKRSLIDVIESRDFVSFPAT